MVKVAAGRRDAASSKRGRSATAGLAPVSRIDRLLGVCGVVMAGSSIAFAGYMVADDQHAPRIAGLQYLSIFARPSYSMASAEPPRAPAAPAPAKQREAEAAPAPAPAVDTTPTGSIGEAATLGRPLNLILKPLRAAAAPAPPRYAILDVSRGVAVIADESGARRIAPGDVVPGLGRIAAIERRGAHWIVAVENGPPLEWPPRTALPNASPSTGRPGSPR
jgi:hypothetical protein